ncbi:DUF4238 domain-containing protein [Mameliella sp.]|uniref:DUF4238 domain-containing protein n=1 Tax=Mameliella sp. TaxID=1924940 RepID=UPI003B50ED78
MAQSVQNRFKAKNGKLWHFSSEEGRGVLPRNTKSVFKIRNDNTFKDGNASHDELEKAFGRLDDDWKANTDKMISMVSKGIYPRLDPSSKDAFFEVLHRQFWRSPDFVHDRDHRFIEEAVHEVEKLLGPMPAELAQDETFFTEMKHNTVVSARNSMIEPEILEFYRNFSVVFLRASHNVEAFIIGSAIKCAANGLTVVPLSKTVALALRPVARHGPGIIKVTKKNAGIVREANISMAKLSRWGIAGCEKRQISALAKFCPTKQNYE